MKIASFVNFREVTEDHAIPNAKRGFSILLLLFFAPLSPFLLKKQNFSYKLQSADLP